MKKSRIKMLVEAIDAAKIGATKGRFEYVLNQLNKIHDLAVDVSAEILELERRITVQLTTIEELKSGK